MAMTPTGIARTVGLWVLILASLACIVLWFFTKEIIWPGTIIPIFVWIVGKEIWGVLVGFRNESGKLEKMTISTAYKRYIQRVGWIGYVPLVLFWIAMTGLVVHLAFW